VVAAGGIDRRHHQRQANRVDGIDLPVLAACEVVGFEVVGEVLAVVAALVIVLNL
jgi:hypothetical protein